MNVRQKKVMIVAGEASGDQHGRHLAEEIRRMSPETSVCGIGGEAMKSAGVSIIFDSARLSVVGITEVIGRLPTILAGFSTAREFLGRKRPDLLILIDFPDFNLRLAAYAKKIGIPVLYYISPQVWAWRSGRVHKIRKIVDHMAVILPFEEKFYRKHDVPVTFVGHPLMDVRGLDDTGVLKKGGAGGCTIGLLPGSRTGEIRRHLPLMLDAAKLLSGRLPGAEFLLPVAPGIDKGFIDGFIDGHPAEKSVTVVAGSAQEVFSRANLIVAASGTVTLEAAVAGTPMVVIYRVSKLSYWLGRALIRVPHIALVNLIAGREIVPELVQDDASPEKIAEVAGRMVEDPERLASMKKRLLFLKKRLGGPGASASTARIALSLLRSSK